MIFKEQKKTQQANRKRKKKKKRISCIGVRNLGPVVTQAIGMKPSARAASGCAGFSNRSEFPRGGRARLIAVVSQSRSVGLAPEDLQISRQSDHVAFYDIETSPEEREHKKEEKN